MSTRALDHLARAPIRHWNIDGLPEILGGSVLFLIGGVLVVRTHWPSPTSTMLAAWLPLLLTVSFLIAERLVLPRLKMRLTYLRVGYVRPRAVRYRGVAAFLLGAVAAGAALAWTSPGSHALERRHLPLVLAGLIALLAGYCGWKFRLPRFYASGGLAIATALVLPREWPPDLGVGAIEAVVGGALVLGGTRTLRRLLRSEPAAAQNET